MHAHVPFDGWHALQRIRETAPVVHNITNHVVMNTTANALLALGASPVMAHAEVEMEAMVGIASALVLNIGTLSPSWVQSMVAAGYAANRRGIPIVLDPVGAGATGYRTETALMLLETLRPRLLRGNASEMLTLAGESGATRGVDSTASSNAAVAAAQTLHGRFGCTVCISGPTDWIVGSGGVAAIHNGHPLMPKVTGLGCTASALCGAFAAVTPDADLAAAQAMLVMGVAGEMAAEKAAGPGTLQLHFLDALFALTESDLQQRARAEA